MNKKIRILLITLIIINICLVSCKKKHNHNYQDISCNEYKSCIICGELSSEKTLHEWIDATCENPKTCSKCNITEGTILEHNYGEWEVYEDATIYKEGIKFRICNLCGFQDEKIIEKLDPLTFINLAIDNVVVPTETTTSISLLTKYENVTIFWKTSNSYIMTSTGKLLNRYTTDKTINLVATYTYGDVSKDVTYTVKILKYTDYEKIIFAKEDVLIPDIVTGDLEFKTKLTYGVTAEYISSNPEYISNDGKVNLQKENQEVTITIIYKVGEETVEESVKVTLAKYDPEIKTHQIIQYAKNLDLTNNNDLEIVDNKVVLKNGVNEGIYISDEIATNSFTSLVGSWAAITSINATCELEVSVKVNGVWSEYITYSPWGLGLENASHDQSNSLIKLSTDEVIVLNGKKADAIKYQVTLRRTTKEVESPKLSLVSFALEILGHSHYINPNDLPKEINHDVPKLCQNVVPVIGNSICSATSTTMLLKYNGFNFTDKDSEYEHRYIASIVKDYGNNIYGNWVYNTVTMGAYGLNAYVARMYSIEELMYHLAYVGPVALSVKGQMTSNLKDYYTAGHLIVATGYKYNEEGKLMILCNDPNVSEVACEYDATLMKNVWRNIAYVYEKQS